MPKVLKDLPVDLISRIPLGGETEFNLMRRGGPSGISIADTAKRQYGFFRELLGVP